MSPGTKHPGNLGYYEKAKDKNNRNRRRRKKPKSKVQKIISVKSQMKKEDQIDWARKESTLDM